MTGSPLTARTPPSDAGPPAPSSKSDADPAKAPAPAVPSPSEPESPQPVEASQTQPAEPQPEAAEEPPAQPEPPKEPILSKAYGTKLESEPPGYVKTLDKSGLPGFEDWDWLEFGLEQNTRFEYRDDDYRRPNLERDAQFLMRSRVYLGVRKILDPLRFGLEFQDSRQFLSDFPESNRDVDEADFLQAFAELYFADALGKGYPVQFRAGRMTLDYTDRRLVTRSNWGNTTTAFDGFRLRLGQPRADWQFDFFAAQPVEKRLSARDRTDEERWLYGLVFAWRKWAKVVTLEPYWFILDEDRKDPDSADREIHSLGLHAFGPIGKTAFDYDLGFAYQFGEDGQRRHRAYAIYSELGYTFKHQWKPRLSFSTAYATGDRDPKDNLSERFDKLFQSAHSWSTSDHFSWQNTINPKLRIELTPHKKFRFDAAYGAYWLASDSDAWPTPGRRDPKGRSGDCIGQEIELRARYEVNKHLNLEAGYSHIFPGPFVENTGDADDSDFFYVQTTLRF